MARVLPETNSNLTSVIASFSSGGTETSTPKEYAWDFEKNDFKFYIYIFNVGSFEYYIEKEKKVEEFGKLVGINKPVRGIPNERYTTTKYNYNFSKDYDEPTYDIFDDKKLDEIVENIFNEIKSYMDIIVKELN